MSLARRGGAAVAIALMVAAWWRGPLVAHASMFTLPVGTERQAMPLDCEATSLTIALRAVGIRTTQQFAQSRFPVDLRAPVLGADRLPAQWGDPYIAFVGHVYGSEPGSNPGWASYPGWGAYAPTVAEAAAALGAPVSARSGWSVSDIYAAVLAGHPVLVWTTVSYSTQTPRTWTAWDGRTIPWTLHGHVVVMMGVDRAASRVMFSDPLVGGYNSTSMAQFERTFAYYGNMALVVERVAHALPAPPRSTARPAPRPSATPKPTAAPAPAPSPTPSPSDALVARNADREMSPMLDVVHMRATHPPELGSRRTDTPVSTSGWRGIGIATAAVMAATLALKGRARRGRRPG